ncbi:MAG: hypothetical protein LBT49_06290, partial [Prevotellaceae bacterium]|nr:hypothetical protein [Prevotellaceae bacterium]
MKFSRRISIFLLIGIFLLACEEEQQAWLSEMEGTMTFSNNPNEAGASLPVTFSIIGGISTPGNVAYTWSAPGFGPSTFTGSSFETVAPITAGTYSIIVTAKAAGYRDVTCTQVVTVKSCTPMQGTLAISNPGNVYKGEALSLTASGITLPAGEHITYEWVAPDFSESYTAGSPAYTATAPGIAGTYSVSLTAEAAHYCPITIQDTIQVLDGRVMTGELRIIASDETVAGYEATFIASGPTTPDNKEVTYEWYPYPGLPLGDQAGNSYTIRCPVLPGTYSVGVTASAEGYSAATTTYAFTVVDSLRMAGTLTFNIPPEVVKGTPTTLSFTNSINKPSAGVSFT